MDGENENAQFLDDCGLRSTSFPGLSATSVWGGKRGYLFIFLIFCFGLHLLMMPSHHHGRNQQSDRKKSDNDIR
jgi:hypothetical protein